MIESTVSHYKILEKLGGGGMGVVFKAEDTKLKRTVALKFLPPVFSFDQEAKKRFINEAQTASSLQHNNICNIHDIDETKDGQIFICMDCYEGETLKKKIERGQIKADEAVDIIVQVATGLQKAHEKGIIHRDIKPANIFITNDGVVKILDFGLAKLSGQTMMTKMGETVGTIAYMSPEQTRGELVDNRTDIWSLGVVLYEMITRNLPFNGDYDSAMIYSILNEELQQLSVFKTDIPERLAYVIHKALQKDRAHRYQAVGELIHDLKNIESCTLERGLHSTKKQPSIAVLPFRNLSTDAEQEYFCDGLAEEIINTLTQIENLHVVARTSAFTFKGKQEDIREIGRKLNVESVLEGSVRKSGNRLRITAQLINIADGYHLWSEKYDRVLEDIFAIQDEISLAIVEKLKGKLLREDKSRLERRFTDNEEAYHLYLKGRFHWNKRMVDDIKKAVNYFNQAIEKDSSYALAYVGLAQTYVLFPQFFGSPGKEYYPRAEVAARRALELDENLAEAYSALGLINYVYAWDWLGAEREFKKAIELNPNYPTTYHWYSLMLNSEGRLDEAMNEIKRAQQLDPLSLIIIVNVGWVLYFMRQYDKAIDQYKKALELDQNFMLAHFGLGNAYCQKGIFADAIAEYQKVRLLVGSSPFGLGWLGYTYARSGKKSEARKVLDELLAFIKQDHVVSYEIGLVYNGLAENNRAIEWIEKAFEERDRFVVDVNVEPALNNLNSEPRFKALLHEMRLEK